MSDLAESDKNMSKPMAEDAVGSIGSQVVFDSPGPIGLGNNLKMESPGLTPIGGSASLAPEPVAKLKFGTNESDASQMKSTSTLGIDSFTSTSGEAQVFDCPPQVDWDNICSSICAPNSGLLIDTQGLFGVAGHPFEQLISRVAFLTDEYLSSATMGVASTLSADDKKAQVEHDC